MGVYTVLTTELCFRVNPDSWSVPLQVVKTRSVERQGRCVSAGVSRELSCGLCAAVISGTGVGLYEMRSIFAQGARCLVLRFY